MPADDAIASILFTLVFTANIVSFLKEYLDPYLGETSLVLILSPGLMLFRRMKPDRRITTSGRRASTPADQAPFTAGQAGVWNVESFFMRYLLLKVLLLLGLIFSSFGLAGAAEKGRSTDHEMVVDGIRRSYRVYCPENYQSKNVPLMVVLHGGLGNAQEIEKRTDMNEVADNGLFVVVYPNGIEGRRTDRRTWNAGTCCGLSVYRNVDDVRFIESVIEQVKLTHAIDSRRVYAAGLSNGGMMAYRLAREIPQKIAAVVAVSATLAIDNFDAAKDVAVLHIHGTEDSFVPITGGVGEKSLSEHPHRALEDTLKLITGVRQCAAPEVRMVVNGVQSSVYRCSRGALVEVVRVQGGGHAWPDGYGRKDGHESVGNFSASRYAWEFARKFTLSTR